MKCRKRLGDIETGAWSASRDEPGGCLSIGQVVSGMKVARARLGLRCGTWEPVAPMVRLAGGAVLAGGWSPKQEPRAAESVRGRVVTRGTGADRHPSSAADGHLRADSGAGFLL